MLKIFPFRIFHHAFLVLIMVSTFFVGLQVVIHGFSAFGLLVSLLFLLLSVGFSVLLWFVYYFFLFSYLQKFAYNIIQSKKIIKKTRLRSAQGRMIPKTNCKKDLQEITKNASVTFVIFYCFSALLSIFFSLLLQISAIASFLSTPMVMYLFLFPLITLLTYFLAFEYMENFEYMGEYFIHSHNSTSTPNMVAATMIRWSTRPTEDLENFEVMGLLMMRNNNKKSKNEQ